MTQFFVIGSAPTRTYPIPASLQPHSELCVIVGEYFMYADPVGHCIVVVDLRGSGNQHEQSNQNLIQKEQQINEDTSITKQKWWKIPISPNLQTLTKLLQIPSPNPNPHSHSHSPSLILLTSTKICQLTLNSTLTALTHQSCYHLLYQPQNPIEIGNLGDGNFKVLYNQQVMVMRGKGYGQGEYGGYGGDGGWRVFVVGFEGGYRVVGNLYGEDKDGNGIRLICQFNLQIPSSIKTIYEHTFTLSTPHPNTPILNFYKILHQKSTPLQIHSYNLQPLLHLQQPQTTTLALKPEHQYQLLSMHGYYHVFLVEQVGEDFYVCYRRYVGYQRKQVGEMGDKGEEREKEEKEEKVLAHVWVYNLGMGYTRNIIDLKGSIVSTRVQQNPNDPTSKTLIITTNLHPSQTHVTTYIKTDTKSYHPNFPIPQPPLCQSPTLFLTTNKTHPYHLHLFQKIDKKTLYCKLWQLLQICGEGMLEVVIGML